MEYRYQFIKCGKCGKSFLLERVLFGIDHTSGIVITCKECLRKSDIPLQFEQEHPKEAKAIKKWLDTSGSEKKELSDSNPSRR